jgi:hypothetical protein
VLGLNDDVVMGNNQIGIIAQYLSTLNYWFTVGGYHWSSWAFSREGADAMQDLVKYVDVQGNPVVRRVWFDEAFWPEYCEDNDFWFRLVCLDPSKYKDCLPILTPKVCRNSMTCAAEPAINHERSLRYYVKKWGGEPYKETCQVPFCGLT